MVDEMITGQGQLLDQTTDAVRIQHSIRIAAVIRTIVVFARTIVSAAGVRVRIARDWRGQPVY